MISEVNALEAAIQMRDPKHGFLVITSSDGRPLGIVTEWDYISKVVSQNIAPDKVLLTDIMTPTLIGVQASDRIEFISKLMSERGIRRVLVTEKGKVLGAITAKTILERLEDYVNRISAHIARFASPF
ncbi:MAG: CBS domain-containing protein [Nitrososphaerota archaeon]|nr:CBS domain-containing protein [Nitrososphaerota archaeon]